jgi:hypothetical protein
MARRAFSRAGILMVVGVAGALAAPRQRLAAQVVDSTGMPPFEPLALEAGRASRRHPIGAVAAALLCEPSHPLVDSASLAACVALDPTRAAAIIAAFARGLGAPVAPVAPAGADDTPPEIPACPPDLDRGAGPRTLVARLTAPILGVRDGRWEGRLTVELRCRSPVAGGGDGVRTMGKEYLYQWSGRAWGLYQFAWWRAER